MATLTVEHPPHPTAETVIDSDEDLDSLEDEKEVSVGNHKPSKGGADTWVNKKKNNSSSSNNDNNNSKNNNKGKKEKSKRWSFGLSTTQTKAQHGRARTMSLSESRRLSATGGEKTTHLPPKLPLDSITTHTFHNHSSSSLPTPAASPSSESHGKHSSASSSSAAGEKFSSSESSSSASSAASKNSSATSDFTASAPGRRSPNRPRAYTAYPNTSAPSIVVAGIIHKPPTPISPIEESEYPSIETTMPALKRPQKAAQPVPLAPSSVVSGSSGSSASSVSTGSSIEVPSPEVSRAANFRKLNNINTNQNAYFASVGDSVPESPMPEAPAPPSRGSNATSDENSDTEHAKQQQLPQQQQQKTPYSSTSSLLTPKASTPVPPKQAGARPSLHPRSYTSVPTGGSEVSEYNPDAYPSTSQAYYNSTMACNNNIHRKRSSFSSNGSRTTAVPLGTPTANSAGLGLDPNSVFEFLDEGEEDAAAAAAAHEAPKDPLPPMTQESSKPTENPKSPVKPISPKKAAPNSGSAVPPTTAVPNADSYFTQPYGRYNTSYPPQHYDSYKSPEAPSAKGEPTAQAARPMNDTLKDLSNDGENAVVRTPQKQNFKEHARRAAVAAAEAQAAADLEIEEYNEEDYPYPPYIGQGPASYRGRRMTTGQAPPPPPPQDMYNSYPPHPPPPHRSYTDSYTPYGRPQPPPMPQNNASMYSHAPPYMRGMPPAGPGLGSYGRGFAGSHIGGYESPTYASMMNSAASEMATTVLGGRYAAHMDQLHMNRHVPMAPSNLSATSYPAAAPAPAPAYNDYYNESYGYYEDPNIYPEEPEFEEPQSIPSASPQYTKRRPVSGDFSAKGGRNNLHLHSQWTAEWADSDSGRASSRPPTEKIPDLTDREEFELGRDGPDDQSWAKPPKIRRRNTITADKRTTFSSGFSDASSAKIANSTSSRMQAVSEVDKSETMSERIHPAPLNTSLPKQKHGLPTPEDSPPAKECRSRSRPSTVHSNTQSTSFALKNATLTTIPTALGYPHLSNHLASSPDTAMYRRFDNLNHRILLHLQDEICELESLLEGLDMAEQRSGNGGVGLKTRRGLNTAGHRAPGPLDERSTRRLELMGAIFVKLQQYNTALAAYSKILNELPGATHERLQQYREWMTLHQPVVPEEMDFVFKANDFSTLIADPATRSQPAEAPSAHFPFHLQSRPSRSPSFVGQQHNQHHQAVVVEGFIEGIISWIKMQDMPIQLGALASIFFLVPLLLFLCTSTYYGIMILITVLTLGFCYCTSKILFNEENASESYSSTSKPSVPAFGAADGAAIPDVTASEVKT